MSLYDLCRLLAEYPLVYAHYRAQVLKRTGCIKEDFNTRRERTRSKRIDRYR